MDTKNTNSSLEQARSTSSDRNPDQGTSPLRFTALALVLSASVAFVAGVVVGIIFS